MRQTVPEKEQQAIVLSQCSAIMVQQQRLNARVQTAPPLSEDRFAEWRNPEFWPGHALYGKAREEVLDDKHEQKVAAASAKRKAADMT